MLHQRRAAAQKVANRLMSLEKSLDQTMAEAFELTALLPQVRLETGVAAEIGHEAIERMQKACSAIVAARTEVIAGHRELAKTKDRVGLRAVGLGGLMPKAAELDQPREVANAA